jgi:hypothetical protein
LNRKLWLPRSEKDIEKVKRKLNDTNLISLSAMARIQNHIGTGKVQTCFVASNFPSFTEHPVLRGWKRDEKMKNLRNVREENCDGVKLKTIS